MIGGGATALLWASSRARAPPKKAISRSARIICLRKLSALAVRGSDGSPGISLRHLLPRAWDPYRLSKTLVLWKVCPFALVTVDLMVMTFPSREITRVPPPTTLPAFLNVKAERNGSEALTACMS